jgi:hypothetical protein
MCTAVVHFRPAAARSSAATPQSAALVHVDVEGRLVELDHVHAVGLERARLLVQQFGEGHRQLHAVAVVAVGHGVDDRHRAGQRELELLLRVRARQPRLGACTRPLRRSGPTTCGTIAL